MRTFAQQVRASFSRLDMNYDPEWLSVAHGWPGHGILFVADHGAGRFHGVAAFLASKTTLNYALGPFVLWRMPIRQLKLYQGVICERTADPETLGGCFAELFDAMGRGVVFAGAVPLGSALHRQIEEPSSLLRRYFHVLPWGGESVHCRVRWEGSVEKYLASIGKKSAKELQRNSKTLFGDPSLICKVRRFQSPDEIETFLQDGVAISDKTYQKRDLGLGIARGGAAERLMRFAAERGAFFGYILYINGAPAAFRYSFKCGDTCTMKQTGYDPAWADRQVGSVLFLETLRDFERAGLGVDWLDFMPDITLFKLRTTNEKRRIRHYYLFKRTPVGAAQYLTLKMTDALSRAAGRFGKGRGDSEIEKYLARSKEDAGKVQNPSYAAREPNDG